MSGTFTKIISALSLLLPFGALADVNVAVVAPKAGEYKTLGDEIISGVRIAVDDINAQGGLKGEKINLITVDDQCDDRPQDRAQSGCGFGRIGQALLHTDRMKTPSNLFILTLHSGQRLNMPSALSFPRGVKRLHRGHSSGRAMDGIIILVPQTHVYESLGGSTTGEPSKPSP